MRFSGRHATRRRFVGYVSHRKYRLLGILTDFDGPDARTGQVAERKERLFLRERGRPDRPIRDHEHDIGPSSPRRRWL
jgi:hypothetical protein